MHWCRIPKTEKWFSAPITGPTPTMAICPSRSEEHTSELQSRPHLVCRLLLEKKKKHDIIKALLPLQNMRVPFHLMSITFQYTTCNISTPTHFKSRLLYLLILLLSLADRLHSS